MTTPRHQLLAIAAEAPPVGDGLGMMIPGGVLLIYAVCLLITLLALLVARSLKRRHTLQIQASLLSPMGSLYSLTTAFLLSNVIFQFTNLRTAVTQEVVTINKLAAVLSVLPPEQRVEGRRLLYDYGESIAEDEARTLRLDSPSPRTQLAIDRLRDFLASKEAAPAPDLPQTPESVNYFRKASDLSFDLIDARERRLSLARQAFPRQLWLAIAVMYFALALLAFLVTGAGWSSVWVGLILLLASPVPPVLLFIFSHPIAAGLLDLRSPLEAVLRRTL